MEGAAERENLSVGCQLEGSTVGREAMLLFVH